MKKFLTVLFLGLFVAVGTPVLLHADDAATAPAAGDTKAATPKKAKHKAKHKAKKKAKKAAAKAADASASDASAK
jgi:hypothetical protein